MYRPNGPQSASHLVTRALAERGLYAKLRQPSGSFRLVGVNDCNDDRIFHNKNQQIERALGCRTLPLPFFGGIIRLSPHCPGYKTADARFILGELLMAVKKRGVRIFFAGAHGEECGWCAAEGIEVAQRHWLARDAKRVILATAEKERWTLPSDSISVCTTWHRRYTDNGHEHQRTRVISCAHPIFDQISVKQAMRLTDRQFIERTAPYLLDLVAAS